MKRFLFVIATLVITGFALPAAAPPAVTAPPPPAGVTGIALDGKAELGWQPVQSATGYTVYRGTSAGSITTLLTSSAGVAATTFTDTGPTNDTTYYYAVRAIVGGIESANSGTVSVKPVARGCSTGNAIVLENCYPGNPGWNVKNTAQVGAGGIEGYATAPSINKGQSVDLKVNSDDNSTFRIEIYRTGYYGGLGARLFSTVRGVKGVRQPNCVSDSNTGLIDCSNWGASATITTTASWPSGIYLLRIVREDNGSDNHILLVVRDDASHSPLLYGTAFSTFEAYNNYGGKSFYDFNSSGGNTVAGTARAVKVSLDRPFEQPRSGLRDWYTRTEYATVYWLEQSGYPIAYVSNTDLEQNGALLLNHRAYLSAAHDEYWSGPMRKALEDARAAGVDLFFTGSNEVYWKVRFENSVVSGGQNRVQTCYKSTQSGPPDPSGIPTGTWRDPAGANKPENALSGEMYVGDNDGVYFPFVVSASQGTDRLYRYTGLDAQAPGSSTTIGSGLVGWEWDARSTNGFEPPGVKTLASSPVNGQLIQNNGRNYTPGSTNTVMVKYTASSGALVVTTGTNHWNRGLARNVDGVGEPDSRIQQVTTNVLADMGAIPETPAGDITLDNPSTSRPPAPTGAAASALGTDSTKITWNAVAGADGYNVYRALAPRDGGQPLGARANGTLVPGTSFTDIGLVAGTDYYYVVTAVTSGVQSLASNEAHTTTAAAAGQATRINSGGSDYTSLSGATFRADSLFSGGLTNSVPDTRNISGTSDPALYRNERWGNFSYAIPLSPGKYDVRFHFVELYYGTGAPGGVGKRVFGMDILDTPTSPDLSNIDIYAAVGPNSALVKTVPDVTVTDGTLNIKSVYGSADDPEVAAIEVIPKAAVNPPPTVTDTQPLDGEIGVSRLTDPRATFSRAMDPSTITASSFTLKKSGGTAIPATVSYDGSTTSATLTPSTPLSFSTTYTATIASSVKASDGTFLAGPVSWTFTTTAAIPPTVTSTSPGDRATGISSAVQPRAVFSRSLDPATVTPASFILKASDGTTVPATVGYDGSTRTATLKPTTPLDLAATYTATVRDVTATDGVPLASPVSWSFTITSLPPIPPDVTKSPVDGATDVPRSATVDATFSRGMDPPTITSSSFTLSTSGAAVPATVSYDSASRVARLTPAASLAYSTTYTATLAPSIRAADETPLAGAVSWTFTTVAQPPAPSVTDTTPADGASFAARSTAVTAKFSLAMDPATIATSSFKLQPAGGTAVAATVAYDNATKTATLTPNALLAGGTTYTATVTTAVSSAEGTALPDQVQWTFTTAACPCSLFSVLDQPSQQNGSTQDGRGGTGPWTYELGVKVKVDEPMRLSAIRFFKVPLESGTHTGTVWSASGAMLAQATFVAETASGWQSQTLASPLLLQPGTVYYVSVNANKYFGLTSGGLRSQVISGPLRSVADGSNGVFASAAGQFPTQSYNSTNYYTDVEVVPEGDPAPPGVVATTPAADATGVARTTSVTATFSRPIDPATVNSSTFTLTGPSGLVPATVAYDDVTSTATLTPSSVLAYSTVYAARLSTGVRARNGKPLDRPVSWSFTVHEAVRPQVTATLPSAGAADIGPAVQPRATFSKSLDPSTVNASTFTLTGSSGIVSANVSYDDGTKTATLTPSAPLPDDTYTARLDSSIESTDGALLGTAQSWTFIVKSGLAAPMVTGRSPADGSVYTPRTGIATATFSRSMDPATLAAAFTITGPGGTAVATSVSYDNATLTATLTPSALLDGSTVYTARVGTAAKAADGTPLAAASAWTFTTATCPCSLLSSSAKPTTLNVSTQDARTGAGPWSYELGVKVKLDEPMRLTAVKFYKQTLETGTHTANIWSLGTGEGGPTGGVLIAQVPFTNETASGWQRQELSSPIVLNPNTAYIVSVNANAFFGTTPGGLQSQIVSGPLRSVADGANGVFGSSAGQFPSQTYNSANYYTDLEVVPDATVGPPNVSSTSPANGDTAVVSTTSVNATFSRPMDPATIGGSTFTVAGPTGTVAGTVTYSDSLRTATFTPAAPLAYSTTYTARVTTGARARDGQSLANAVVWSFKVADAVAPQVTSTVPAADTTDVGSTVQPRATFSKSLDLSTVNVLTFTLTGPSGAVPATVAYDDPSKTAILTPTSPLGAGVYTARLDGSIMAADASPMGTPYSWKFTVGTALPPFAVNSTTPADAVTGVARDVQVQATFNRSADPATVNGTTYVLRATGGSSVPVSVTYDDATKTATLKPNAMLATSTSYTAEITTGVLAVDGSHLAPKTWSFTTGICPCSLFSSALTPASLGNPTRDGRGGTGPWSYEFGVKFTVDQPTSLKAIRFYKDAKETGGHTGTIWTAGGAKLASAAFTGETASGWQQTNLATPLQLQAGTVYVASVGFNAFFDLTGAGLAAQVVSAPLRSVADGRNGVYGSAAGVFPTSSWNSSNYFIDVLVR